MERSEKAYEKLIHYVEENIMQGKYKRGDKLPPERDLALQLGLSRNSVREGISILERMGALTSIQGAGNFISSKFDKPLIELMSLMFMLETGSFNEISEFRYALEYQALALAIRNVTDEQVEQMEYFAEKLASSPYENERVYYDKQIHYKISEASCNGLIIANLFALNEVMDIFIKDMRARILSDNENSEGLLQAHVSLVEAVKNRDLKAGRKALDTHFSYIYEYLDR